MAWQDMKNAVLADTCYCDNQLAAKDVSVSLPAVNFLIDVGLERMLKPTKHNYEFRWAQNVLKADGTTEPEGCKAFITGVPKGVPATGLEIGSNIESEISIGCTRYQLFCAGKEILCIDRLSQICRINGVDYYSKIASLL